MEFATQICPRILLDDDTYLIQQAYTFLIVLGLVCCNAIFVGFSPVHVGAPFHALEKSDEDAPRIEFQARNLTVTWRIDVAFEPDSFFESVVRGSFRGLVYGYRLACLLCRD